MKATIVTVESFAKTLGLTKSRIHQLVQEGMPRAARGKYNERACLIWYAKFMQKVVKNKLADVGGGEFIGLNDQRVRGMRADAELKEINLAMLRGQTANLADVRRMLSDLVLMTKARLLAIPGRLAVEVMGVESRVMIQAKIEQAIKDALNQLADDGSNYPARK